MKERKELEQLLNKKKLNQIQEKVELLSKKLNKRFWLGINGLGVYVLSNLNYKDLIEIEGLKNIESFLNNNL